MRRIAIIAALLSGCASAYGTGRTPAGLEDRAVGAAIAAWSASGRAPAENVGALAPGRTRLVVLPRAELQARCFACWPNPAPCDSEVAACYFVINEHAFDVTGHFYVYLSDELTEQGRANGIVHETLHEYRGRCAHEALMAGARAPWDNADTDLPDRAHRDADVWGPIQARALEMLREEW